MENYREKDDILKGEIERLNAEFSLLYEISNAIRTTLRLDQILYIILTAITSHEGLGFNRAMLFLVNEKDNVLEGTMGIGPYTAEEAGKIWSYITQSKMTLEDFISSYDTFKKSPESKLNSVVKSFRIPIKEDMGILAMTILEGMPFEITTQEAQMLVDTDMRKTLNTDIFVTVPLKAKDKVLGAILVDNAFDKKPITKADIKMLTMFANHAGLAIENSRLYEETVYLSSIDWSTKLWNYGKFQERLSFELERSKITNAHVSLVMLDVDNFKHYNDTLGHMRGDAALRDIASVLSGKSRKVDTVARYGGEEFAIVMPNTIKENARLFAERLRAEVEKRFAEKIGLAPQNRLTISCGVANYPEDAMTKDDLISMADKALYEAKGAGKNRTLVYTKAMDAKKA